MTKKINYFTAYDESKRVCGYVFAEVHDNCYTITESQYKRALKNRTIGGDANVIFNSDKVVYVVDKYNNIIR